MKRHLRLAAYTILALCSMAFKREEKHASTATLSIQFQNVVGGQPLQLNDSLHRYHNANGDDFFVTTFKYYISNIMLITRKGEAVPIPDSYLLVNGADSLTLSQQVGNVPPGKYNGISFTIGVDSARNFAGAQTGCLDPAKGMFWTWKSGYIFVKMEGVSDKSTGKKNRLVFHIGGVKSPNNTIRTYTKIFKKSLKIKKSSNKSLAITADVASLFKGKTTVDFASLNFTMGGPNSVVVADNYADSLFTVKPLR